MQHKNINALSTLDLESEVITGIFVKYAVLLRLYEAADDFSFVEASEGISHAAALQEGALQLPLSANSTALLQDSRGLQLSDVLPRELEAAPLRPSAPEVGRDGGHLRGLQLHATTVKVETKLEGQVFLTIQRA